MLTVRSVARHCKLQKLVVIHYTIVTHCDSYETSALRQTSQLPCEKKIHHSSFKVAGNTMELYIFCCKFAWPVHFFPPVYIYKYFYSILELYFCWQVRLPSNTNDAFDFWRWSFKTRLDQDTLALVCGTYQFNEFRFCLVWHMAAHVYGNELGKAGKKRRIASSQAFKKFTLFLQPFSIQLLYQLRCCYYF